MGTRHLICVRQYGEYKVAQYGQWDGYPEGAGLDCLHFLRDKLDRLTFTKNLQEIELISTHKLMILMDIYNRGGGHISFMNACPEFCRDTGAEILPMIQHGGIRLLEDQMYFAADSLMCEWAYVIDMDCNMFEVYEGFNQEPLTPKDRFYSLREYEDRYSGYHGVKIRAAWDLDELPSDEDFLAALKDEEGEDG